MINLFLRCTEDVCVLLSFAFPIPLEETVVFDIIFYKNAIEGCEDIMCCCLFVL